MSKVIPLTQDKVVLVDDTDYNWLNQHKWCAVKSGHNFYAIRYIYITKDKKRLEIMHRLILGLQPYDNQQCDHIDGNGLNNQRVNLRCCTIAQNAQAQRKFTVRTSRFKGVHWDRSARKWRAQIGINRKRIYLGLFSSEINAAQTYDKAALKYYGDFALTNVMLGLLKKQTIIRIEQIEVSQ